MPAGYMFHDLPPRSAMDEQDPVEVTVGEMDRFGIRTGLVSLSSNTEVTESALTRYPGRFVPSWTFDPNDGVKGMAALVRAHERWGVRAASFFPHGTSPQVAIDAPLAYIYYAKCVELGIPVFVTVGIAGPRVPSMVQSVDRLDQVLYDFPDLVVVMRHGAEPWTELAVKLMVKWPNLYYSTQRVRPEVLPEAHHRLCQHPWSGQGHVRRLLPHGPLTREDLRRAAAGAVPGPCVAEIPVRQRRSRPEHMRESDEDDHP